MTQMSEKSHCVIQAGLELPASSSHTALAPLVAGCGHTSLYLMSGFNFFLVKCLIFKLRMYSLLKNTFSNNTFAQ